MFSFLTNSRIGWSLLLVSGATIGIVASHTTGETIKSSPPQQSTPSAEEEIARQVLKIQEQLGGSIIRESQTLSNRAPTVPAVPNATEVPEQQAIALVPATPAGESLDAVTALREAAWQLDTTAHRLEQLDLYSQADALREVAQRLRHDARGRKQAHKKH